MRAPLARVAVAAVATALLRASASAQESEHVRPRWPRAGRWPVPEWVVVAAGAVLVALVLFGLVRAIRRRRRR